MAPIPPRVAAFQDMPPKGGYPKIPSGPSIFKGRGPPGWMIWAVVVGGYFYGNIVHASTAKDSKDMYQERRYARMAIFPMLETEQDRLKVAHAKELDARERIVMEGQNGWTPRKDYRFIDPKIMQ